MPPESVETPKRRGRPPGSTNKPKFSGRPERSKGPVPKPGDTLPEPEIGKAPKANPASGAWWRVFGPMSPGQARRQLFHIHRAFAKLVRSTYQVREEDLQEAGDTYADLANDVFPILRAIVRIAGPLVLIGALVELWARILNGAPWYQRRREAREAKSRRPETPQWQTAAEEPERATPAEPEPETHAAPGPPPRRPLPIAITSRRVG